MQRVQPPIGHFAAVMGLVGLGVAGRAAASLFPGVVRAPAYFTEVCVALGLLAFLALAVLYAWKALAAWAEVREDLNDPVKLGFAGAPCVATGLVAAGLAPYLPEVASALWWLALAMSAALLVWALVRIAQLGFGTRELHPGWIMALMGGIVLPAGGLPLGHDAAAKAAFVVAALAGVLLVAPLAARRTLPEPLRPTWFMLLVPPSFLYLHGTALFGRTLFEPFFYVAVVVFAAVLFLARTLPRAAFGPAWWSIAFPLDAFALAAARFARGNPEPLWRGVAAFAIVLATLAAAWLLARTIIGLTRRPAHARVQ